MDIKSRDHLNIRMADLESTMGKCLRLKVGCVISRDGRIISSGYNGSIIPGQKCTEMGCNLENRCEHSAHAEENAIAFAARWGIDLKDTVLYVTTAPCYKCARLIVQSGICEVVYRDNYNLPEGFGIDAKGIALLMSCGIRVRQFNVEKHL